MIPKKYVVGKFDHFYEPEVKAVCDSDADALEYAELLYGDDKPEDHVRTVAYIRSTQTVAREALYDLQNGATTIPRYRGEVINAEL